MANELASLKVSLSFPAPGGGTSGPSPITVLPPFKAMTIGKVDIADATPADTAVVIPFGGVSVKATAVMVRNKNNQDMGIRINAAVANHVRLPPDGVLIYAAPAAPGATPLTAISVVTTAEQEDVGQVEFWVFGDPE